MSDRSPTSGALTAAASDGRARFDAAGAVLAPHLPGAAAARPITRPFELLAWLGDFVELTKPRIAVLVLLTVTAGYALAAQGDVLIGPLLHTLFGVALAAAGSSAFNQWIEQATDARMRRTMRRPLPAGRLSGREVVTFGMLTAVAGPLYLAATVNGLTAWLTASTVILYAFVYTPLKKKTSACTAIGAIPGALPPLLGWVAARGTLDFEGFSLFAILFLWQFPHFLAIAWLYRDQYANAGLRMLPGVIPAPRVTGQMAACYALVLLPISLLPGHLGLAGNAYLILALLLGVAYLTASIRFLLDETTKSARMLLWTSLIYLPGLLTALVWDHFRLLQ